MNQGNLTVIIARRCAWGSPPVVRWVSLWQAVGLSLVLVAAAGNCRNRSLVLSKSGPVVPAAFQYLSERQAWRLVLCAISRRRLQRGKGERGAGHTSDAVSRVAAPRISLGFPQLFPRLKRHTRISQGNGFKRRAKVLLFFQRFRFGHLNPPISQYLKEMNSHGS